MRTRVRRDLHDEDAQNERWTDSELDRHIQRSLEEVSIASPREIKATLTTTANSRDLSLATLRVGLMPLLCLRQTEQSPTQ